MKAALLDRFGAPEVLHYGDVPDPVAAAVAKDAIVRNAAATAAARLARKGAHISEVLPKVLV